MADPIDFLSLWNYTQPWNIKAHYAHYPNSFPATMQLNKEVLELLKQITASTAPVAEKTALINLRLQPPGIPTLTFVPTATITETPSLLQIAMRLAINFRLQKRPVDIPFGAVKMYNQLPDFTPADIPVLAALQEHSPASYQKTIDCLNRYAYFSLEDLVTLKNRRNHLCQFLILIRPGRMVLMVKGKDTGVALDNSIVNYYGSPRIRLNDPKFTVKDYQSLLLTAPMDDTNPLVVEYNKECIRESMLFGVTIYDHLLNQNDSIFDKVGDPDKK